MIAGTADSIVPFEQSRAMYEAAPEPKDLFVVEGADHNDPELADGAAMTDAVVRFVRDMAG